MADRVLAFGPLAVTPDIFHAVTATTRPKSITYGPLADVTARPDVVLVRANARGVMTVCDALPDLAMEREPPASDDTTVARYAAVDAQRFEVQP